MKLKNIILSTAFLIAFSACDDLFEPAVENFKQPSDLENMPSWAVGLLGHAYIGNPLGENATIGLSRKWLLMMLYPMM